MAYQKAGAFEGFETFTNEFKMVLKMHLCIIFICAFLQFFVLYALWDIKDYNNRLMIGWYKASLAAPMPFDVRVSIPLYEGGQQAAVAKDIVRDLAFKEFASKQNRKYIATVLWSFLVYLFYPMIVIYFRRRAQTQAEKAHVRGSRLIDPGKYEKLVKNHKEKTDLPFGLVNMPVDAETKHLFIVGKTGCGKTNSINHIIERLRDRDDRAIIYDSKGDFLSYFYDPGSDLIFNPLDRRTLQWTMFNDIRIRPDIDAIANSQIPPPTERENPFWRNSARGIFSGCLKYLKEEGHTKNRDIWELLNADDEIIATFLKNAGSIASKYLEKPDSDTAKSIISTLTSQLASYEYLAAIDGGFSITDWVGNGTGFLFISSYSDIRDALKPLISIFMEILSLKFLSLPEKSANKKTFFIIDELWTLQKMPALLDMITQARSKGGALILSAQEISQLEALYGKSGSKAIINNCGNKLLFGCNEHDIARYYSQLLGEEEVLETTRSYTLGVDTFKDGVNITQGRTKKDVILASEISNLPDLQAFVKFNNYSPLKTRFTYKDFKQIHASFEPSDNIKFDPPRTQSIDITDIE